MEVGLQDDSLASCLRSESCLVGNVSRTMECLSELGPCSLARHQHSKLGECLGKGNIQHFLSSAQDDPSLNDMRNIIRYQSLDCLRTSQSEISVRFSISDSQLNLDWSGELTYQVSIYESHQPVQSALMIPELL